MIVEEWEAKYNEIISLANELSDCPYYDVDSVCCTKCPIANKCHINIAIISLSRIE